MNIGISKSIKSENFFDDLVLPFRSRLEVVARRNPGDENGEAVGDAKGEAVHVKNALNNDAFFSKLICGAN